MIVLESELEQFIVCCFNKFSQIRKFWRTQTAAHAATEESLEVLSKSPKLSINIVLMKIFQTKSIDTIQQCR